MNSQRAHAYSRVTRLLAELGPSKLHPAELDRIRDTADTLIFCSDLHDDDAAREALEDTELLVELLVQNDRWQRPTAERLIGDLRECGPALPLALSHAA